MTYDLRLRSTALNQYFFYAEKNPKRLINGINREKTDKKDSILILVHKQYSYRPSCFIHPPIQE